MSLLISSVSSIRMERIALATLSVSEQFPTISEIIQMLIPWQW